MWVIYERPRDYPAYYVVRRWEVDAQGARPTQEHSLHASLQEAREAIPAGLALLTRSDQDEPQIVETWL